MVKYVFYKTNNNHFVLISYVDPIVPIFNVPFRDANLGFNRYIILYVKRTVQFYSLWEMAK